MKKNWKSKQTSWYGEFSEFGIEIGLFFALNELYLWDRKLPNCCEIVAKYVNVKNRGKLEFIDGHWVQSLATQED